MNVLKKLTIKDLKLNKKRTIVTIIGIMLSVALITAVATMFQSFIDSMIKYEKRQKGDYHVSFRDVPYEEVVNIKNNRSVEDTYLVENVGYAVLSDSKNEYKPYAFVMGFTDESEKKLGINLVEGRFPENENEIVIPTHLKTNGRVSLSVGDTITLDVGKRMDSEGNELTQYNPYITSSELEYMTEDDSEDGTDEDTKENENSSDEVSDDEIYDEYKDYSESIVDTETKTYTVVGICERPSMEDYEAPGYTFITHIDEEDMKGKVQVYVRYKKKVLKDAYKITAGILGIDAVIYEKYETGDFNSEEEYQQIFELLKDIRYSYDFNPYLIELEDNPLSKETLGGFGIVVVIVCIIIIVTSVFCIKNSFDISITEKIREYGMLRSVGATKKQIRKNVMYEALILGLIGIPLGILCGELASFILIKVSNLLMVDELFGNTGFLVFSPSVIAIVISIMLGAITIYLSAFRSAFKASRVSPIVSIRNSGDIKVKAKKLKSPKPIKKIFGMGGEISYKNLKRNKKKYRTTIISITVSVIIFVALSSFMKMAFNLVRHQVDIREYDVSVNIYTHYTGGGQFTDDKEIYEKLYSTSNFDNIKECAFYRETTLHDSSLKYSDKYKELLRYDEWYDGEEADIYVEVIVPDDKTYRSYIDSLGLKYEDVYDKGILADNIKIMTYDEDGKEHKYRAREFKAAKGDSLSGTLFGDKEINLDIGYLADTFPFCVNEYSAFIIISEEYYNSVGMDIPDLAAVYSSDKPDKLQDDIEKVFKDADYSVYIDNVAESARQMRNLFLLVAIFLYGFIIVISLIGITNIFNTITTNMELRKKEFAMLKSVGMTTKEFNHMIRLESAFMGTKSLLYGLPLGLLLSYIIYTKLGRDEGLEFAVPYMAVIMAVLVVFLLIAGIMRYSMSKINKQNTIETIRNENI